MHRDLKVLKSIENRNFIVPRGYKEVNNLLHYFFVLSIDGSVKVGDFGLVTAHTSENNMDSPVKGTKSLVCFSFPFR